MCTVTFLPSGTADFILTSNRDEKPGRSRALPPQRYEIHGIPMVFPKDAQANGTWIATAENGFTLCLLNGAFETHSPHYPYRMSRGVMVLDFFRFNDAERFVKEYDFSGIEPFTLLVVSQEAALQLTEIRLDASGKLYVSALDAGKPHIWSSATLYPVAVRHERERWFADWLSDRSTFELEEILHFHHFGGTGNRQNDLLMNRNVVGTVSITAVARQQGITEMVYEDLVSHEITLVES